MSCNLGYVIQHHLTSMMQLLTEELSEYNMQLMTTKCLNTAIMMWYLFLGDVSTLPFLDANNNTNDSGDGNDKAVGGQRQKRGSGACDARVCDSLAVQERGARSRDKCSTPEEWAQHPANPANVAKGFRDRLMDRPSTRYEAGTHRTLFYVMLTDASMPRAPSSSFSSSGEEEEKRSNNSNSPQQQQQQVKMAGGGGGGGGKGRAETRRKTTRRGGGTIMALKGGGGDGADEQFFPGHVFVIEKITGSDDGRLHFNIYQSYINNYDLMGHQQMNKSLSMSEEQARDLGDNLLHMYEADAWDARTTRFWKRFTHVDCSRYEGYQFSRQSFMCFTTCQTNNCTSKLRVLVETKRDQLDRALAQGSVRPDDIYGNPRRYATPRPNTIDRSRQNAEALTNGVPKPLTNAEMKREFDEILSKL